VLCTWLVRLSGLGLFFFAVTACSNSQDGADIPSTQGFEIILYQTPSPIAPDSAGTGVNTPTPPPSPTPTPFKYSVVSGDTLLVIAARYNITLDQLLAANPEVDPYLLSIGEELIIPQSESEGGIASLGFPTPVPVEESEPSCYPTSSGGLWCIWSVRNSHSVPLENLSAEVSLFDFRGEKVAGQNTKALLNVLWPGDEIPLITFFEPPVPSWTDVQVQLASSLEVAGEGDRYLPGQVNNLQVQISENGLSAIVSGTTSLQGEGVSASEVWVALVAYDAKGEMIGSRRWEGGTLEAGGSATFFSLIYSLGPPIDQVKALVEARP